MTFQNFSFRTLVFVTACAYAGQANLVFAQESAYKDLNECTKNEQIKATMTGAISGALAGFGAAFLSGKSDNAGKAAALGGVAGGAIGFATAYYKAIGTCQKLNPSWIPESSLIRDPTKSYAQVNAENRYRAGDGIRVVTKSIAMPETARPGEQVEVSSTFDVMTPDGAETAVVLDRQLFAIVNGNETSVPFPARPMEERTVAAGRSTDSVRLPITSDAVAGTVYRVQLSVAPRGGAPNVMSKMVKVV